MFARHARRLAAQHLRLEYNYATKSNSITVELDRAVGEEIAAQRYKPRRHPGAIAIRTVQLPERLRAAIVGAFEGHPIQNLIADAAELTDILRSRRPPTERWQVEAAGDKAREFVDRVRPAAPDEPEGYTDPRRQRLFKKMLKRQVYMWRAIEYDRYTSLKYLMARAAPDYAALVRVLGEVRHRDPAFRPRRFFDFGAGVGCGAWAALDTWPGPDERPSEFYAVDVCPATGEVAREILARAYRDGSAVRDERVHRRQFMPSAESNAGAYELVLCAHALLELPSAQERLRTVLNLWRKTAPRGYLALVEHGTNTGYRLVCEARDFVLSLKDGGSAWAPCPHDAQCPRLVADDKPCRFPVNYYPLKLGQPVHLRREYFSYCILKKGGGGGGKPDDRSSTAWPRLVAEPTVRAKQAICRVCCADGTLKQVVFTACRHGTDTYRCARGSRWGDLLPLSLADAKAAETISGEADTTTDTDRNDNKVE